MGSSLLRNAVYIMLTTGVNSALGYVFWLVVARSYAAEEVGVASALIAAMAVVAGAAILPALSDDLSLIDDDAARLLLFAGGVAAWSVAAVSDYLFVAERRTQHMFTRNLVFGVVK